MTRSIVAVIVIAAALILLLSSTYVLDETQQAVVVQFGRPVGDPVREAGLHFKLPFVQEVRRFDRRLLAWDGAPTEIPTRGREFILVDTTARWRIVDPLRFMQSVKDENGAQSRLDDKIDSEVRDVLSSTELTEIVRSKGWKPDLSRLQLEQMVSQESAALDQEVRVGREELARRILEQAREAMPEYGIELVDFRIKRLNYIKSVQEQVFNRMISERQRVAEQFRAEGQGQSAEILGETQKRLSEIISDAQRQADIIKGEAEAEATRIYNEAYSQDPEFYAFYRSLESYERTLGANTTLFLGTDSDYFRYLRSIEIEEEP